MPQPSRPRKGSRGFGPRTRASSEVPRVRSWPDPVAQPGLQGFAAYKVGMTHVIAINDETNSPLEGTEETVPATILETPPVGVAAVRGYQETAYGTEPVGEVWAEDDQLHEELDRLIDLPDPGTDRATDPLTVLDSESVDDVRVLTYTIPSAIEAIGRKEPQLMEIPVGGDDLGARLETAADLLEAGTVSVRDVFRSGQYVDVIGVTKGKGTQGPVKRWGVQKRKGKHARQGYRRRIGNLGPWHPSRVRSTVPQQGQTGYHQRTEHNKRILSIGDDDVTPDGGFVNYGEVDGEHILLKGSVPGPKGRLVRLKAPVRPPEQPRLDPEIRYVSTTSQQG